MDISRHGSTNEKMWSILVVDDDRTCLSDVASLLKGCSYQVLTAKDPLDALCILRTRIIKFDLIISDVHMPGLDGFELQRRIHQEFQIPVVLMSGDREASNQCEGIQSGTSFLVVKPITTEDLKSIWDFGNQWKKKLAKGKNITSDDIYDNDNEDDVGNKLYETKSKRKLQITNNEDHNDGKNRALEDDALLTKRNKVNWTPMLHDKFVKAMQHLGPERSVPRNILSFMNVPALRRKDVADYLQQQIGQLNRENLGSNNTTRVEELVFCNEENPREQQIGQLNRANLGSNNTTKVEELVFCNEENPRENHDNGGIANSADNTETFNFHLEGNQPSDDDQQVTDEEFWASLIS